MTPAELTAAGWTPWKEPTADQVLWEHAKYPGKQFSFASAVLLTEKWLMANGEEED